MIAITELLQLGNPEDGFIPVDLSTESYEEAANAVNNGLTVAVPTEEIALKVLSKFMTTEEAVSRMDFIFRRNM